MFFTRPERLLGMASGSPLTQEGITASRDLLAYALNCTPDRVKPGGWADYLFGEAKRGAIDMEQASALIFDYLGPSLDTTITATTNAVKLFGEHPDQWRVLREKPYMVPNAINEVIRLESPVQGFSRRLTRDTAWGSQFLPQGARVLLLYGSANRDERRWELAAEELGQDGGDGFRRDVVRLACQRVALRVG